MNPNLKYFLFRWGRGTRGSEYFSKNPNLKKKKNFFFFWGGEGVRGEMEVSEFL